jgi:hypothetical protein
MTFHSEKNDIPLIKETRLQKISVSLKCINDFYQDRNKQRICILKEYSGKSEKSAFRGMIIPSLRHLGLIDGLGENISVSANGMLLLAGKKNNDKEFIRIAQAIFLELDIQKFHFVNEIKKHKSIEETLFIKEIEPTINSISQKQSNERIKRWIKLLVECGLLIKKNKMISLESDSISSSERDLIISQKERKFESIFIKSYKKLMTDDLGIIKISKLREETSRIFYNEFNEIITETQFDNLLSKMPHVTDSYIISFGEPIGSDEKLFKYNDRYFKSLNIKFFKGD